MFRKILVANRGEIAVRVIRACREMGIRSVAVYSDVDRAAKHVRLADEAYAIGPAPATQSYLSIDRILEAASRSGAEAVHPGYGFLSENAAFAERCGAVGVKFIGPSPQSIRSMGVKTEARRIMTEAGVPVVPGTSTAASDAVKAASAAANIGYPVMLKAAAGGGGKGMRLVENAADLAGAWNQARGEAAQSFGDDTVYIEKALVRPRHVEVQVLADEHGGIVHLGERECSIQRRHQKVLEESPSPLLAGYPEVRANLCRAAVAAARATGYSNAGTVEFLMDSDRRFYFLEMNTRLQVEHPVTELVTGIDLVREQIRVAAGKPLRHAQSDIQHRGHAMECRIYAEDPDAGFLPSPGRISRLVMPEGPGIRVDSGAEEGWTVPIHYDPLIAKLCAWAPVRDEVIKRLRAALRETVVGGIATTLGFFGELLADRRFRAGEIDTDFISHGLDPQACVSASPSVTARQAVMLAAVQSTMVRNGRASERRRSTHGTSRWKDTSRRVSTTAWGSIP